MFCVSFLSRQVSLYLCSTFVLCTGTKFFFERNGLKFLPAHCMVLLAITVAVWSETKVKCHLLKIEISSEDFVTIFTTKCAALVYKWGEAFDHVRTCMIRRFAKKTKPLSSKIPKLSCVVLMLTCSELEMTIQSHKATTYCCRTKPSAVQWRT